MRYRRLTYRHTIVTQQVATLHLPARWPTAVVAFLAGPAHWRPDADMRETPGAVEIVVDLAGVDEDDVEIQLFDDAIVVEGQRRLPVRHESESSVYHAAGVRQGPFRLALPLVASVDPDAVDARYERGLLHITLPKPDGAR